MKYLLTVVMLTTCFLAVQAQSLPEFNEKPAYLDAKTKQLKEL